MRTAAIAGVVVLLLILLAVAPWLMFWSVGTLFDYHIEVTPKTWLAAILLMVLFNGGHGRSK